MTRNRIRSKNFEKILPKDHSLQDKRRQGSEEGLAKVIIPPVLNRTVKQKRGKPRKWRFAPKVKQIKQITSGLHGCT